MLRTDSCAALYRYVFKPCLRYFDLYVWTISFDMLFVLSKEQLALPIVMWILSSNLSDWML